jgi:hypothetical protein
VSNPSNVYTAVGNVGKTLIDLLWVSIKDDSIVKGIITSESQISLISPKETVDSNASEKLCVFLYRITEFSTMKNVPSNNVNKNPPLYLTLHYLFVPYTENAENDQLIMGKILQVFVDNPVLRGSILHGALANTGEDLRVTMDSLSPDDLNKIWTVLSSPYKITLSYSVSPVIIEPSVQSDGTRVIEKKLVYEEKKAGEKM